MEAIKQNYSYDIILMKSNYVPKGEEQILAYRVRLFDEFIDLPERRLFTNIFPSSPFGEIEKSPCDLINGLNERGVCVTLYEEDTLLGCGCVRVSAQLLKKLAERSFTAKEELVVPLLAGKKTIATVRISIKFSSSDPSLDTRLLTFGCFDVCRPVDKTVNPRDMLLTLGRSATGAVTTCITDDRLMSHKGPPFTCGRAAGGEHGKECPCNLRGIEQHPGLDQEKERERKLLKRLLVDLDIDRVHVPTPPSEFAKSRLWQSKKARSSDSFLSFTESWSDTDDIESQLSLPNLSSDIGLSSRQQEELQNIRRRTLGVCPQADSPMLKAEKYKPPLICPVCRANITWLPKLAACPYCGYKRFHLLSPSEESFDETATAADVLRKHALNNRLNNDAENNKKLEYGAPASVAANECTCSTERVCTRCRIRELCDQMFKTSSKPKLQAPLPATADTQDKAEANEQKETPPPNRQNLIKIFTELQNTFSDKKDKGSASDSLKKACEAESQKASKSKGKRRRVSRAFKKAMQELEENMPPKKKQIKLKIARRPKSKRYTFLDRREDDRPKHTHESCFRGIGRVPCHMGWLWTKSEMARHRSWKPGAITKPIRELMTYFLKDYPVDVINNSRFHCKKPGTVKSEEEEPLIQHPTLHISKKHDEYIITMRPLKDPGSLSKAANPYANMSPIVFRITKDPIATGIRNIKIALKDKQYPVCTCHKPIAECFCRSLVDKKIIVAEVRDMCEEHGHDDMTDTFVFSDLSEDDSEAEFDFGVTPPAGVIKPERRRKPDRVNCETQYNENDWAMPTMYPHPPNAQVQYGGCVVGERQDRFPWIFGKGFVHAEPKPPKMRNKSKAKPKKALPGGPKAS